MKRTKRVKGGVKETIETTIRVARQFLENMEFSRLVGVQRNGNSIYFHSYLYDKVVESLFLYFSILLLFFPFSDCAPLIKKQRHRIPRQYNGNEREGEEEEKKEEEEREGRRGGRRGRR